MAERIKNLIGNNEYPGRGLLIGKTEKGDKAVVSYFIMGRSENSRNRIFKFDGYSLYTRAFDESKVKDPSLIIYRAFNIKDNYLCVSNGDQTENIVIGLEKGESIESSLKDRRFEPDGPNFTPRISGVIYDIKEGFSYTISILKSKDGLGLKDERHFYEFESKCGIGHMITTYKENGKPLPSYEGEPKEVTISGDIDTFIKEIWDSLNKDNRISLFTIYIDLNTKDIEYRIINKNKR